MDGWMDEMRPCLCMSATCLHRSQSSTGMYRNMVNGFQTFPARLLMDRKQILKTVCIHQWRHRRGGYTHVSWAHPHFTVFVLLQMLLFWKQKISAVNYVNVNVCLFSIGYTHERSSKWHVPTSFVTHQSMLGRQGKETRLSCNGERWAETKAPASVRRMRASRGSPIKFQ